MVYEEQSSGFPPRGLPSEPAAPPPGPVVKRARLGAIVLASVLAQLVLIGAVDNKGVTDWVKRHTHNTHGLKENFGIASQLYQWSFGSDSGRVHAAQWVFIGVTVVLTAVLLLALCRGPVTFFRAFVGTWAAAVFATLVGAEVRGFVLTSRALSEPGRKKVTSALFGPYAATSYIAIGALAFGLVTALVVAIVAVATRRSEAVEPEAAWSRPEDTPSPAWSGQDEPGTEPPPVWPPAPSEPPAWSPSPSYERWSGETAETVASGLSRVEDDGPGTTRLPVTDDVPPPPGGHRAALPEPGESSGTAESGTAAAPNDATAALPRWSDSPSSRAPSDGEPQVGSGPGSGRAASTDDTQVVRIDEDDLRAPRPGTEPPPAESEAWPPPPPPRA